MMRTKKTRIPLYVQLAQKLTENIETGVTPVGSILPTEETLAVTHEMSRHTVRQALRELRENGLIVSRARIGSVVKARPIGSYFLNGINSIKDLLQFVDLTEMHLKHTKKITADESLAKELRCPVQTPWVEAEILRTVPELPIPLSYLQLYLPPKFSHVLIGSKVFFKPIYSMIEATHRVTITEVFQEIMAINLSKRQAQLLQASTGQAALKIRRTYYDKTGRVIQISHSIYPSDRFTQSSRFKAYQGEHSPPETTTTHMR
jgi:GntR family transcriptional regulator